MKATIIMLLIIALFIAAAIVLYRLKGWRVNGSLITFVVVVGILLAVWFNRYSILAVVLLSHLEYGGSEAMGMAFAMNNNLQFFVDLMFNVCAEAEIMIPRYLEKSMGEVLAGEGTFFDLIGNLFDLVILIW